MVNKFYNNLICCINSYVIQQYLSILFLSHFKYVSHIKNDTSPCCSSRACMGCACVWSVVGLGTSLLPLPVFDYVDLETKTLQGAKGENSLSSTSIFLVDNSSVDFQKFPDKEILRMAGPLTADFIVKVSPFRYLVFKPHLN